MNASSKRAQRRANKLADRMKALEPQIEATVSKVYFDSKGRPKFQAGFRPAATMTIFGGACLFLGGLLTMTIIGAPLGIPLVSLGLLLRRQAKLVDREAIARAKQRLSEGTQAQPEPLADIADQIRKLAELRDTGVLTDEEFQAKKTKLLGL